jgi:hypothetical protein
MSMKWYVRFKICKYNRRGKKKAGRVLREKRKIQVSEEVFRIPYSKILRRVALVRTDISEET